jgi:hypothetical protein
MASVPQPTQLGNGALVPISVPEVSVVASTLSAGWDGVQALIVQGRLGDLYGHSSPLHVVAFLLDTVSGCQARLRSDLRRSS